MYIGETVEAKPTPIPPTNRQAINCIMLGASALPTADTMNKKADTTSVCFLPIVSASQTPTSGPKGQPKIALPATAPYQNGVSANSVSRKMMAPDIRERS